MLYQIRTTVPATLYVEVEAETEEDALDQGDREHAYLLGKLMRLQSDQARCTGIEIGPAPHVRCVDEYQTGDDHGLGRDRF